MFLIVLNHKFNTTKVFHLRTPNVKGTGLYGFIVPLLDKKFLI